MQEVADREHMVLCRVLLKEGDIVTLSLFDQKNDGEQQPDISSRRSKADLTQAELVLMLTELFEVLSAQPEGPATVGREPVISKTQFLVGVDVLQMDQQLVEV